MNKPVTFAICGCGNRGLEAYATFQTQHPEKMKIVAGADSRPGQLALLRERYGVAENMCFSSDEELLNQPKLADVMIISTQDRQHVPEALQALDKAIAPYLVARPGIEPGTRGFSVLCSTD